VPALHAAALEGDLFESVALRQAMTSWQEVLGARLPADQLQNTVHAALTAYDLTDLTATLGEKLRITQPVDARGRPLKQEP